MDLNADEVKIIEGKFTKKYIIVEKMFSIKLPAGLYIDGEIHDMEQLMYILKKALLENEVHLGNVYGVVNSTKIIMREVSIPRIEENLVQSILSYQLADYLPVNPEEYVIEYMPVGDTLEDGVEKLIILLICIPKKIVESHLDLFKNINLRPQVLDFTGNVINKLIYYNGNIDNQHNKENTIACIDLENESLGLTITQNGIIKVSRVIEIEKDVSSSALQEFKSVSGLEVNLNKIFEGIGMVFDYFLTREKDNNIDLILLYGTMADIEGIDQLFSNYFGEPCMILKKLNKVRSNGEITRYANSIGALIRIGGLKK
jgi:type IV pilus assembly protein PilM